MTGVSTRRQPNCSAPLDPGPTAEPIDPAFHMGDVGDHMRAVARCITFEGGTLEDTAMNLNWPPHLPYTAITQVPLLPGGLGSAGGWAQQNPERPMPERGHAALASTGKENRDRRSGSSCHGKLPNVQPRYHTEVMTRSF